MLYPINCTIEYSTSSNLIFHFKERHTKKQYGKDTAERLEYKPKIRVYPIKRKSSIIY